MRPISKTSITSKRVGANGKRRHIWDHQTLLYMYARDEALAPPYKGRYYM